MSNALEAASLIMVPSGYEDGTLGSLKPTDGSGDFTFTRGSNLSATRINEQGYIEKGYENLLLQSNSFLTTWATSTSASVSSGQTGYDGSSNAWLLSKTAASQYIQQQVSFGGINTFSVYIKAGTSNWVALMRGDGQKAFFDLSGSGSLGNVVSGITSKIESAGNGWFRCSFTFVNSSTNYARIYPAEGNGDTSGTSGSIYIQDAMLNQGLVAYPYIETTTAPVAGGILEDMPRLDWSGSCPSLLLEPSRTNLITDSEYITIVNNASVSYNATESPEGLLNAPVFTATSGDLFVRSSTFAISTGTSYSISFYIKAFGTAVGKVSTTSVNDTASDSFTLTDSWQRITYTGTATNTRTNAQLRIDAPNVGGVAGEQVAIYGLQVEQDATYPTSYIPTYGVSQTRLGDVCEVSDVASLIGQTEGTYVLDWIEKYGDSTYNIFGLSDGSLNNYVSLYLNRLGSARLGLSYKIGTQIAFNNTTIQNLVYDERYKAAVVYTPSSIKLFLNGQLVVDESNFNYTGLSLNRIEYNYPSGNNFGFEMPVNQTLLFPTALSDSECIALTTI